MTQTVSPPTNHICWSSPVPATGTKDMGEMETQAVHELITWNIMEDQVAETREARKRANQRRNTVQKEKDAGLDQIATIARTLVIPLNCFHTGRHENTGSKAINTRSRDLRWPVTDSSKNSSVRLKAEPPFSSHRFCEHERDGIPSGILCLHTRTQLQDSFHPPPQQQVAAFRPLSANETSGRHSRRRKPRCTAYPVEKTRQARATSRQSKFRSGKTPLEDYLGQQLRPQSDCLGSLSLEQVLG